MVAVLALSEPTRATLASSTINCTRHMDRKMANAQIRSNLKCGSGSTRYMFSRAELRYHMVMGRSSFGGPKISQQEKVVSGGKRFDSIIAMLCGVETKNTNWQKEGKRREEKLTASPIFLAIVESVMLANGLSAPQHSTYLVILEEGRFLDGIPPGVAEKAEGGWLRVIYGNNKLNKLKAPAAVH